MFLALKLVLVLFISRIHRCALKSFMTIRETSEEINSIEKLDYAMKHGLKLLCTQSSAEASGLLVNKIIK